MDNEHNQDSDLPITDVTNADLTRTPLSGSRQSYQSNMFKIRIAVNPLVAAAAPLLTTATQLREQSDPPDYNELHRCLCHEIKALEHNAHKLGYRSQVILAARYLLCAMIDEIIAQSNWFKASTWAQRGLLQTFQREAWGGERFFLILERSAEDPIVYIDLLELGYICLSQGFRGKYESPDQTQALALVIDNLYDLIRHQRGELSRNLLVSDGQAKAKFHSRWRLPPLWLTIIIALGILAGIFVPYHHRLETLTQQAISNIQKLSNIQHE